MPQWSTCRWPAVVALVLAGVVGGCKDLTGSVGLPAGTPSPGFYANKTGALGMRNAAILQLEDALPQYFQDAGLLTDELEDIYTGVSSATGSVNNPLDERILPTGLTVASYGQLQGFRTLAAQALGALAAYDTAVADTESAKVLRGELYAMEGYAEIMLADLFCSGVPLSTLVFQHDYTDGISLTTQQVYRDALVKFDTALTLGHASDSVVALALVGQGRAYVDLGEIDSAAAVVQRVPTEFRYRVSAPAENNGGVSSLSTFLVGTVANQEGLNGLPFLNGDPRSAVDTLLKAGDLIPCLGGGLCPSAVSITAPTKYRLNSGGFAAVTLASGTEARLIAAEQLLQHSVAGSWLTALNQLRTSGSVLVSVPDTVLDTLGYTGCMGTTSCDPTGVPAGVSYAAFTLVDSTTVTIPDPSAANTTCQTNAPNRTFSCDQPTVYRYADPAHTHVVTVWLAGTGGVTGLPPLADPGAALTGTAAVAARVSLLFRERAYWLFLDGHRQGDLRRLLRQYGTNPAFNSSANVYPTGRYLAPGTGFYGSDVTAPIPTAEAANPNFHGCFNRAP